MNIVSLALPQSLRLLLAQLVLSVLTLSAQAMEYDIEVTQLQLQQQIDALLPLSYRQMAITASLRSARVELAGNEEGVVLHTAIRTEIAGGFISEANAVISGQLRHETASASFFLDQPTVRELTVKQLDPRFQNDVREVINLAIGHLLGRYPIYQLSNEDASQRLARSTLREVIIEPGVMRLRFAL